MKCYRDGGCGPYEMYSCADCPASKPEYAARDKKVLTNADHIRSMTGKELAEFLMKLLRQRVDCFAEGVFPYHPCPQDHDCCKCGVDWLKQPYKEDE